MDMCFLYVLSGWEGSASDGYVFEDACAITIMRAVMFRHRSKDVGPIDCTKAVLEVWVEVGQVLDFFSQWCGICREVYIGIIYLRAHQSIENAMKIPANHINISFHSGKLSQTSKWYLHFIESTSGPFDLMHQ